MNWFKILCLCVFTGVKIIGGYRELTGEEFGIYIKRVIVGGLAALDGRHFSAIFSESVENRYSYYSHCDPPSPYRLSVCHSLFQVGLSQVT